MDVIQSEREVEYVDEVPALFLADHGKDYYEDRSQWSIQSFRYDVRAGSPKIYIPEVLWQNDRRIALFTEIIHRDVFRNMSIDLVLTHDMNWYGSHRDRAVGLTHMLRKIERLAVNMAPSAPCHFVAAISSITINIDAGDRMRAFDDYEERMERINEGMREVFDALLGPWFTNKWTVLQKIQYDIAVMDAPGHMFISEKVYDVRQWSRLLHDLRDDYFYGPAVRWTWSAYLLQVHHDFYDADERATMMSDLRQVTVGLRDLTDKLQSGDPTPATWWNIRVWVDLRDADQASYYNFTAAMKDMVGALHDYVRVHREMTTEISYRVMINMEPIGGVVATMDVSQSYDLSSARARQSLHYDPLVISMRRPPASPEVHRFDIEWATEPDEAIEGCDMQPKQLAFDF